MTANRWTTLGFLLLLLVGCGGGGSDADGANWEGQPYVGIGGLTFKFARAQTVLEVPFGTSSFKFEFFTGVDGSGIATQPSQAHAYASEISISPIDARTRSVVVTAFTGQGVPLVEAIANVTVTPGTNQPVTFSASRTVQAVSLEISPRAASIAPGASQQFTAVVAFENDVSVTNPSGVGFSAVGAATIDPTLGLATAGRQEGSATITATFGELSSTATLIVDTSLAPPVLTSLSVTPDGERIGIGGSKQFFVSGLDQFEQPFRLDEVDVTWSATSHLTIDSVSGLAVGRSQGQATVTVRVGNLSGSASVSVFQPSLDGIVSVTPSPVELVYGGTPRTLVVLGSFGPAPVRPLNNLSDGLNFFVTGDLGVVEIQNDGVLVPVGVGSTTVTASAGEFELEVPVQVAFGPGGNQQPQISFDTSELVLHQDTNELPFAGAVVRDDQANFAGGVLVIGPVPGGQTNVSLFAPTNQEIGSLNGPNGTPSLSISLDRRATPQQVSNFLGAVVANSSSSGGTLGVGTLLVSLTDGPASQSTSKLRQLLVLGAGARNLTVYPDQPLSPTNFHQIQDALDVLHSSQTPPGSLITVGTGNFAAEGTISIASLYQSNLTLRGANAGHPVGAVAVGASPASPEGVTEIQGLSILTHGVTIDGFCSGVLADPAQSTGYLLRGRSVTVRNNVISASDTVITGVDANGASGSVVISNNAIKGFGAGILFAVESGLPGKAVIIGNLLIENMDAVQLGRYSSLEMSGNRFVGTLSRELLVEMSPDAPIIKIAGNDFRQPVIALYPFEGTAVLNLRNNYWGKTSGPTADQLITTGNAVIDAIPYSTMPFTGGV